MKKFISIVLATLMILTAIPFAFASETEASRVNAWEGNYQLLIDTVLDNENYAGWNYVDQNEKAMTTEMNTYTALAFYDDAWVNYATKNVDTALAEEILLAIIGKAEYSPDTETLDTIIKVVDGVDSAVGVVDKVSDTLGIDFSSSEDWGTALKIIGIASDVLNYAGDKKDEFIDNYEKVLSVQMANIYYIELLQYVVDNAEDTGLVKAAQNLIDDMSKSLDDVYAELAETVAEDAAGYGAEFLLSMAISSNVYTATANSIYGGVKTVTNAIWGTSNKYNYLYNLKVAVAFQELTAEFAKLTLDSDNEEKTLVAFDMLITTREVGDEQLYNLKKADASTISGKISSKLYGEVYEDVAIEKASLEIIRDTLYNTAIEDMVPLTVGLYIYCPVSVAITTKENVNLVSVADGTAIETKNDYGIFATVKSEYSDEYLKVCYLTDNYRAALTGTDDGSVTVVMDVLRDGIVEDWSFTDLKMAKGYTVVFDTEFEGTPVYTYNNGTFTTGKFNDVFVPSTHEEATTKEVVDATIEVGKDETKSFIEKIKEFFQNLFASFFNIFKFNK